MAGGGQFVLVEGGQFAWVFHLAANFTASCHFVKLTVFATGPTLAKNRIRINERLVRKINVLVRVREFVKII